MPLYVPDEELGGKEVFKNKVLEVNSKGGHITTYINVRIVNTSYIDQIPEGTLTNHKIRRIIYEDTLWFRCFERRGFFNT